MAERARLESGAWETTRGFESLPLRCSVQTSAIHQDWKPPATTRSLGGFLHCRTLNVPAASVTCRQVAGANDIGQNCALLPEFGPGAALDLKHHGCARGQSLAQSTQRDGVDR
jgi:hypothetical protein